MKYLPYLFFYLAGWPAWTADAGAAITRTCRVAGNFFLSPTWRCRRVAPPPPLPDSRKLTPAEGSPSKLGHDIQSYEQHSGFVFCYIMLLSRLHLFYSNDTVGFTNEFYGFGFLDLFFVTYLRQRLRLLCFNGMTVVSKIGV